MSKFQRDIKYWEGIFLLISYVHIDKACVDLFAGRKRT